MFNSLIKKLKDKLEMYDTILANLIAGNSIIEPDVSLDSSKIHIGYNNIVSDSSISKYFIIKNFPDYLQENLMDAIRVYCIRSGVKINFYIYGEPHEIRWDSPEMKNRLSIWKDYVNSNSSNISVFEYRNKREVNLIKDRIVWSTKYLNEADLEHKRKLFKVTFLIEISSKREEGYIMNLSYALKTFKSFLDSLDIKYKELSINMIDWLSYFGIFSLKRINEIRSKINRKILTDDILANFNGYKQGRVGYNGIPLGMDVMSKLPIMKKFKADPDAPENWLISAETGGGKSYFVKTLLTYLLADGKVVTVMDYEGDEYYNLANYIRAGNSDDVKIISMGKGSTEYFDSMEIADLTGDEEIDADLKENAINYTMAIFRTIVNGLDGNMNQWEERVISSAIKRVYDKAGVTDDMSTWHKSKGLRIKMVYNEIKEMIKNKELIDKDLDNIKHKAAVKIADCAYTYFEDGEAKAGTFKNHISVNDLFKARLIIFSFGMRGATSSQIDPIILALKQLSVANVAIQISNHCKYVKKCFNVKVWEEYQRWGDVRGSAEIISNAMTGGRKRGDINFIITNDLYAILDDSNKLSTTLRQNITSMAIGKIKDTGVIKKFCEAYKLPELEDKLALIAKANTDEVGMDGVKTTGNVGSKYRYAFCIVLDNGKKAIGKVMMPSSLRKSSLFKTGVDTGIKGVE